ncbi:hypothetical protein K491DRAFT_661532 [Lophiostoma macrostomum CBS 122681]|uniref:Zn(2)-C6 fungal-type domain-containing protein n=1 Tax=Lophiostoma macrostomum CBS 122681 TaxID=1314788 RepID=A0A6A6T1A3_9PLEO|nr:hypothetical protein K491DRAFT_661532 [Lophiostoma macrostomum CBS 122681]
MKPNYRVRFASSQHVAHDHCALSFATPGIRANEKSRNGCRECKRRRVKCDETFPVCRRCQRRSTLCIMDPKKPTWQLELPGITMVQVPDSTLLLGDHVDSRLLRQWLERTSQVMVLDPDLNPLSFPILSLLPACPWLASVLQSISAAHENNFDPGKSTACFVERGRALTAFARQLEAPNPPLAPMLLGVFLLGVSSSWIESDPSQYGAEHLTGGRAIFDMLVDAEKSKRDHMDWFAIGTYVYWDMACSLLVDSAKLKPLNTSKIYAAVSDMRWSYHPMAGRAIELLYLLSTLGRYCRSFISFGERDLELELTIEEQLVQWLSPTEGEDPELMALSEAFRDHGLILLYRICGPSPSSTDRLLEEEIKEHRIVELALKAYDALSRIPSSSTRHIMLPIPLLTVGSELREEDEPKRKEVIERFGVLRSMNRTPVNLWAIEVLEEVWEYRRKGIRASWVEVMLWKGWTFTLG